MTHWTQSLNTHNRKGATMMTREDIERLEITPEDAKDLEVEAAWAEHQADTAPSYLYDDDCDDEDLDYDMYDDYDYASQEDR